MFRRFLAILSLGLLVSFGVLGADATAKPLKELLPVELTSKDFGSQISDGNIWL